MKKIIYILILMLGLNYLSCSSFLDEESYGGTTAIFDKEEGIEASVYQVYTKVNNIYGQNFIFGYFTENGTDILLRGNNNGESGLADYRGLDAFNGSVAWIWNHCYKALWNINLFFETIDATPFKNEGRKDVLKAEMYVLQALFLWIVTETWGDTYLPKTTDKQEGLEARRSTRAEFYTKIISSLETAVSMMPATRSSEYGRIDQSVAKAFLARMYLFNEQWDKAITTATSVINDYNYELAESWDELWDETKRNKEFVWTTEFSKDESFGGGASRWWEACAMYIDKFMGVKTEVGWTGYGGCRMLPSIHYLSLFDKKADLRWAQGHQWLWLFNDAGDDTSEFPSMQNLYVDTALYLHVGILPASEKAAMKKRYTVFDMNDLYDEKGVPKDRYTFVGITKFDDHTRPNSMSELSGRNYPVIRLTEMYFIRAEANIRKPSADLNAALQDMTHIRKRVIATGYDTQMALSTSDMTLDFILDEKAREFTAEFQRWFDLKRTGKLLEKVKAHNPDASANIRAHHLVRPVPQAQFDGMPDPTTLGQNEGY